MRSCRSSWPQRSKRPELAGVTSTFTANVPQVFADVDRDKVLRQGVALGDVYQTMQAFLGGLFVNQFNRFGRQWRVFLQAEGEDRVSAGADRAVLRAQRRRARWCRFRRCSRPSGRIGPQFTNRFNVYRAAQITGAAAPGYSSGQAMAALEEVARADAAARDSATTGPTFPIRRRQASGATTSRLRAVARLRVPDPGGAL